MTCRSVWDALLRLSAVCCRCDSASFSFSSCGVKSRSSDPVSAHIRLSWLNMLAGPDFVGQCPKCIGILVTRFRYLVGGFDALVVALGDQVLEHLNAHVFFLLPGF